MKQSSVLSTPVVLSESALQHVHLGHLFGEGLGAGPYLSQARVLAPVLVVYFHKSLSMPAYQHTFPAVLGAAQCTQGIGQLTSTS